MRPIFIARNDQVIEDVFKLKHGGLVRVYLPAEGRNQLFYFGDDQRIFEIKLPGTGAIDYIQPSTESDAFIVAVQDNVSPATYMYVTVGASSEDTQVKVLDLGVGIAVAEDITNQTHYIERDGYKIYYDVIGTKAAIDAGHAPAVVTVYGHYNQLVKPAYKPGLYDGWLRDGGIYVVTHPRGVGAFQNWPYRKAPTKLECRQITVDDFAGVVEALKESGLADPADIHAEGASARATMISTAALQNPGLLRSVAARAGCFDTNIEPDACSRNYFLPVIEAMQKNEANAAIARTKARLLSPLVLVDPANPARAKTRFLLIGNENDDRVSLGHSRVFEKLLKEAGYNVHTLYGVSEGHAEVDTPEGFAKVRAAVWSFFKGMGTENPVLLTNESRENYAVLALEARLARYNRNVAGGCLKALSDDPEFQDALFKMTTTILPRVRRFCIVDIAASRISFDSVERITLSKGLMQSIKSPDDFIGLLAWMREQAANERETKPEKHDKPILSKDTRFAELAVLAAAIAGADIKGSDNNGTSLEALKAPRPNFDFHFDGFNARDKLSQPLLAAKAVDRFLDNERDTLELTHTFMNKACSSFSEFVSYLIRTRYYERTRGPKIDSVLGDLPQTVSAACQNHGSNRSRQMTIILDRIAVRTKVR